MGTKGRPFYRVVVAHSTCGRNGKFVEAIGTYDPMAQPKHVAINADRALYWLVEGAQPTETIAYLLNKVGVLDRYFEQRPKAKENYGFLDKRTAATSVPSAIDQPKSKKDKAAPAEAAVVAEPAAEPVAEPAVEEAVAEEAVVEAPEAAPEAEETVEEPVAEAAEEPAAEDEDVVAEEAAPEAEALEAEEEPEATAEEEEKPE